MVVDVAVFIPPRWLLLVDNPGLVVDDVLVGVLATGEVAGDEPLVGIVIELQLVALLPVIEAADDVHTLVARSPVVQPEGVGRPFVDSSVKLRGHDAAVVRRFACLSSNVHVVKLVLSSILRANDLVDDVLGPILSCIPVLEESLCRIHLLNINVDLVAQTAESHCIITF